MKDPQNAPEIYDVAIVGFGPTGATLANLLAICGIGTIVFERESDIYHLPRAVHFDDETMRVFQTVGIADALTEKVRVNPGMRFVDADGAVLLDWPRPADVSPQGWHASYRLHQPDLERLLRKNLEGYGNAVVKSQSEVVQLVEAADHIAVTYRNRQSGQEAEAAAKYVVGCDGARSFVRNSMGSGMVDLGFRERWLVVDFLLKRDMPELGDHSIQFCNPDRPMTYCRSPANRRRWEIRVLDHEADEHICQADRVWELVSRWITPADADLERSAVYTFHSAFAESWRDGRILLAGDAAHLTPPFMGQGMCAGIRDAANLAWKLALCVKELARPDLLDSYEAERSPHVREFITTAVRLGGLINSLDRASALSMADRQGGKHAVMESLLPKLGGDTPLFDSPDCADRGKLFSQPKLANDTLLDDVCGYGPLLIFRDAVPSCRPSGRNGARIALSARGEPALIAALEELQVNAVLVRPDRYIAASARTDAEIAALANVDFPSPLPAA